jgi:hypothetical protein
VNSSHVSRRSSRWWSLDSIIVCAFFFVQCPTDAVTPNAFVYYVLRGNRYLDPTIVIAKASIGRSMVVSTQSLVLAPRPLSCWNPVSQLHLCLRILTTPDRLDSTRYWGASILVGRGKCRYHYYSFTGDTNSMNVHATYLCLKL